jgi:glycosyltransferase involved in cell wall biosynthesis
LKKKFKVAIIANILPKYREGFYKKILKNKDLEINIFCQKNLPVPIETAHKRFKKNVQLLKYLSFRNESFVLTYIPIFTLLKNYDIFMVEGNPRYVSHFLFATLLLFLKKKVILWTMVHSSRNNKFRQFLRLQWSKLFKYLFVYTDYEKKLLRSNGFHKQIIYPMNNGLDLEIIDNVKKKTLRFKPKKKLVFLSCARLLQKNRFDIAIKAFSELKKKYDFKYILIGDGDQSVFLKSLVKHYQLENFVIFTGKIYDEKKLATYFLNSDCMIHPASVGLSLIHAFSYGLPVITHSNRTFHNPEFAAFKNNHTGFLFKMNDYKSLLKKIEKFICNNNLRKKFKINCYNITKYKYNSYYMAQNFINLINQIKKI